MQSLELAKSVNINEIMDKKSLSPKRYQKISINNKSQKKVADFLDEKEPFYKGDEPGSITYVKKSDIRFLRNSCINNENISFVPDKLINLNPKYGFKNMVNNYDVLLCKDANIGDTCLYVDDSDDITVFSSGIVKLNFRSEKYKYYCLAFMKDEYFQMQLDALTPKGSTIRHSKDLFLKCLIPSLKVSEEWAYDVFESLLKNIAHAEKISYKKLSQVQSIIQKELITHEVSYKNPDICRLIGEKRIDAGIYSKAVFELFENIKLYKHSYSSIDSYGFKLKRGPNLAKRDLGRSIKTTEYRKNYNVLVYPSDISDGGYILKSSYIGARNPVWFLESKNILFSAEGTVGKTFVVCGADMRFTTNFHGMIIYPKKSTININKSIFVGLFLNYLRAKGIFEKLSVGGQGGSFAVGYWDILMIPNFPEQLINALAKYYHNNAVLDPFNFDICDVEKAGVYELNNFRIKCFGVLKRIISDIKADNLKDLGFYKQKFL